MEKVLRKQLNRIISCYVGVKLKRSNASNASKGYFCVQHSYTTLYGTILSEVGLIVARNIVLAVDGRNLISYTNIINVRLLA